MGLLKKISLTLTSQSALRYARSKNVAGIEFVGFGQEIARRMKAKKIRGWRDLKMNPVAMTRFAEFAFASKHIQTSPGRSLDVASPGLLSLYVGRKFPDASITMINPDANDCGQIEKQVAALEINNLKVQSAAVDILDSQRESYDTIWCISVIEHINGAYDDTQAMKYLYNALKPGGKLILTTVTDLKHRDEYREMDHYGTQQKNANNTYFFQRHYTQDSIRERLFAPLGIEPMATEWWGENVPGVFDDFERQWLARGTIASLRGPRLFADHFRIYPTWADMPGRGIACFVIAKPS